jgi:hypothetical protein
MKRTTLVIAVLVALACTVSTVSAAGGTPASLAANVAATAVTHRPFYPYVGPVYRPRVVYAPVVVPVRRVLAPPLYARPLYRPIIGGPVYVETPYVSVGVGY